MTAPTPVDDPSVLQKGQRLYVAWASAGGSYPEYFPWERLSDEDHRRWHFLARAVGDLRHEHRIAPPADVAKFGGTTGAPKLEHSPGAASEAPSESLGLFEYHEARHPSETPLKVWEWIADRKASKRWWQFWKPTPYITETHYQLYLREVQDRNEAVLDAVPLPYSPTLKNPTRP